MLQTRRVLGRRLLAGMVAVALVTHGRRAEAGTMPQDGAVTVVPADPSDRISAAGEGVTIALIATNRSSAAVSGALSVTVPPGWRLLSRQGPLTVGARARDVILMSIAVPRSAAANAYRIAVRFTDARGAASDTAITVRISERRDVQVALLDAPTFVPVGATYVATYTVSNRGNVPLHLRIRAATIAGFRVTLAPSELQLASGDTREIRAEIVTPASLPAVVAQHVTVTADVVGNALLDTTSRRTATSRVDVIPVASEREEAGHTLPVAVTVKNVLTYGGHATTLPNQREQALEVGGAGTLTASGATRYDLRVNTRKSASLLTDDRQEYRLSLANRDFDVWLGDQVYSLTPLTQPGRYAFGGGGRATLGRLTLGGFTNRNRFAPALGSERAGFAALRLWGRSEVSANQLFRTDALPGTALATSRISSARARLLLPFGSRSDIEVAEGSRGSVHGRAGTGQFQATLGWSSFEVRHTLTDSTFPGASGLGVDESYLRLALTPWRKLWIRASSYDRTTAPLTDLLDTGIVQDRRRYALQTAGIGYGIFGLERERLASERGTPSADRASQELVRLRAGKSLGPLYLAGTIERGSSRLTPLDNAQTFQRVTATSSVSFGPGSLSLTAERVVGRTIYSGLVHERMQGGLFAMLRLGPSTDMRVSAYGYHLVAADTQTFAVLDATLIQRLPFGHTITVRTRRTAQSSQSPIRDLLELGYRVPLAIPVPGSRETGAVRAHVFDAASREPVRGAVVRLGDRVLLTDDRGQAVFANVKSDEANTIQLDRRGASGDMIPGADHALSARVGAGHRITVEIPLVRGGRIIGRVRRFDIADFGSRAQGSAPTTVESDSIPPLTIALTSGTQIRRRAVDEHRRFEFADVPPGVWTVRIAAGGLPEQHVLADTAVEVSVVGADTARVELRMLPRQRTMRMVGSGVVRATPSSVAVTGVGPLAQTKPQAPPAAVVPRPVDNRRPPPATVVARSVRSAPPPPATSRTDSMPIASRPPAAIAARPPLAPSTSVSPAPIAPGVSATASEAPVNAVRPAHWYRVAPTDQSIHNVAFAVYDDDALWPKIWVANRASVPDPDRLGEVVWLRIPEPAPLTREERGALADYLRSRKGQSRPR